MNNEETLLTNTNYYTDLSEQTVALNEPQGSQANMVKANNQQAQQHHSITASCGVVPSTLVHYLI